MPTGSKRQVINGTVKKTAGGLTKKDIKVKRIRSTGKVRYVSKAKSEQAKAVLGPWNKAVAKAKQELGIDKHEFVLLKKSSKLYKKAAEIYYV